MGWWQTLGPRPWATAAQASRCRIQGRMWLCSNSCGRYVGCGLWIRPPPLEAVPLYPVISRIVGGCGGVEARSHPLPNRPTSVRRSVKALYEHRDDPLVPLGRREVRGAVKPLPDPNCLLRGGGEWHDRPLVMSGNPPCQASPQMGWRCTRARRGGGRARALAPAPCPPPRPGPLRVADSLESGSISPPPRLRRGSVWRRILRPRSCGWTLRVL
eukprot:scaffold14074_cov111-Isochrysis_galbana.AAC.8